MPRPSIRTTVVDSYPVPDWLMAMPSRKGLIDATKVVFKTQEMAGNRNVVTRADIEEFSRMEGMSFRAEPAGIVEGPIDEGTLKLPRTRRKASRPRPSVFRRCGNNRRR